MHTELAETLGVPTHGIRVSSGPLDVFCLKKKTFRVCLHIARRHATLILNDGFARHMQLSHLEPFLQFFHCQASTSLYLGGRGS